MKIKVYIVSILLFVVSISQKAIAQCAMCKASAETSVKSGDMQAVGVNMAVLYVLVLVFLIIGVGGYFMYKLRNTDGNYE